MVGGARRDDSLRVFWCALRRAPANREGRGDMHLSSGRHGVASSRPSHTAVTLALIGANLAGFAYELSLGPALEGFLRDYGVWMEGLPARPTERVPPYNTAVKREVLLGFGDRLERDTLAACVEADSTSWFA